MRSRDAWALGRITTTVGPVRGGVPPSTPLGPFVPPTQLVPPIPPTTVGPGPTRGPTVFTPQGLPVPTYLPPVDAPAMAATFCYGGPNVRDARGACYRADAFGNPFGSPMAPWCCGPRMAVAPGTSSGYYVPLAVPPETGVIDLLHASGVGQVPGGPGTVPVPGGGCIKALSFSAMTGTVYEYGSWGCSSTYKRQPNGSYVRVTRCSCI